MLDLFELLPDSVFWPVWYATLAGLVLFGLVQFIVGYRLKNSVATKGIVSLQLAGTSRQAQDVLDSWTKDNRTRAAFWSVWTDFGFILFYALALSHGCAWASSQVVSTWDWERWLGPLIVALVWVAAACDVGEDIALLAMLRAGPSKEQAARATRFAVAKFSLIGVGLAFLGSGVVAWSPLLSIVLHYALTHLGFVLTLVIVYGIVFGLVGKTYGIPSLYWNDNPLVRISASCAVTLLLLDLGVISFYEVRDVPLNPEGSQVAESAGKIPLVAKVAGEQPWLKQPRPAWAHGPDEYGFYWIPPRENADYLQKFLRRAGWPFLLILALPAVFPWFFTSVPKIPLSAGGKARPGGRFLGAVAWLFGIGLGVVFAHVFLRAGPGLYVWFSDKLNVLAPYVWKDWIAGDGTSSLKSTVAWFYVIFLLVYVAMAWPLYRIVSPPVAVSALMAVLAMGYAMVTYFDGHFFPFMRNWWIPPRVVAIIGLVALFGWANRDSYKLTFPKMEMYYPSGTTGLVALREAVARIYRCWGNIPAQPAGGATLIDDWSSLEAWRKRFPAGSEKPKLAVISVSGGATRSAYWVATVLDRLEAEIPGLSDHVRIISGASGGMVGTAFYVKELKNRRDDPTRPPKRYKDLIPYNSIRPVARFIALRDLWRSLLPVRWTLDRGIVLENTWGGSPDGGIKVPIQEFVASEAVGEIPSLIFSPMMVDDGRRLLISNLDLWNLSNAGGSQITENDPGKNPHAYSLTAFEFFRLFPMAKDFLVSTAVRMSASFPYVSPAVNLPTDPPRRVVDAGYYDNYGVQVSSAWLQKHADWLVENTSGVVLIQIRDAISQKERLEVADAPTGFLATIARGFQFFTSPLDAADKARYTVTAFQDDQAVENLSEMFTDRALREINPPPEDPEVVIQAKERARAFFTTVIFENSAVIVYGRRKPDSWPGDTHKDIEPPTEVALDWYLSLAERDGLDTAIPTPTGHWKTNRQDRLDRIAELSDLVARTHGAERDWWLNELEQARNFERLVQLRAWWT